MISIYSPECNTRLKYACQVLFECVLKVDFEITDSKESWDKFEGGKINYSDSRVEGVLNMEPAQILFSKKLEDKDPDSGTWDDLPTLFPGNGDLPFDLFAATFYLVSRYEEYLPYHADKHGRFLAEQSYAFKHHFLERPLVDEWALKLKGILLNLWPEISFGERRYNYLSTVDVDSAFAYRYKGLMRTLGGFAKDLLSFDFGNATNRLKTILKLKHDVFDTYDVLIELHRKNGVKGIFFFLLADYGMNDKGVPHTSIELQDSIKRLDDYFETGIHPGFMSNTEHFRLSQEIKRLSGVVHRKVKSSRQHFLIVSMPETYMRLMDEGIEHDYSMGYASQVGFRMSICTSVPFYNLLTDQITPLMLHPFQVMDATLNMYLELSPEAAFEKAKAMVDKVKAVDGTFISLWHNESLSESWQWKGWLDVFTGLVEYASARS